MKILSSLIFILVFFTELTFDASTSFVRSQSPTIHHASGDSQDSDNEGPRVQVEWPSHSALPLVLIGSHFWGVRSEVVSFAEIRIPVLTPIVSRIERPPIA